MKQLPAGAVADTTHRYYCTFADGEKPPSVYDQPEPTLKQLTPEFIASTSVPTAAQIEAEIRGSAAYRDLVERFNAPWHRRVWRWMRNFPLPRWAQRPRAANSSRKDLTAARNAS